MVTFPALILGNRSSRVCYLSVLGILHAATGFNKPLFPRRARRNNHDCGLDDVLATNYNYITGGGGASAETVLESSRCLF